jgi:hypothetical protein
MPFATRFSSGEDLTSRLIEAEKKASAAPVLRESVEALRQALEAER